MGMFDFMDEEYQKGYQLGRALQSNPALAKQYFAQQEQQQRQVFMNQLETDIKDTPSKAGVYSNPQGPNTSYGAMDLRVQDKINNLASESQMQDDSRAPWNAGRVVSAPQEAIAGLTDRQLAIRLMQAPTSGNRQIGGNLLNTLLKPQAKGKMSDFDRWNNNPQAYKQWKQAGRAPTATNYNQPFLPNGTPNKAYQQFMLAKAKQGAMTINTGQGSIPSGSERVANPNVNSPIKTVIRPQIGSKDYTNAEQGYLTTSTGIGEVDKMIDLIDKHGTETWGNVSGQMAVLYGQILARVAEAQNKGVLQEGELEMIKEQLPDPSTIPSSTTSNKRMIASYTTLKNILESRRSDLGQQFKTWGYDIPKSQKKETIQEEIDRLKKELGE